MDEERQKTLLERVVGIAAGRDDPDIRVALQDKDSEASLLAEAVRAKFRHLVPDMKAVTEEEKEEGSLVCKPVEGESLLVMSWLEVTEYFCRHVVFWAAWGWLLGWIDQEHQLLMQDTRPPFLRAVFFGVVAFFCTLGEYLWSRVTSPGTILEAVFFFLFGLVVGAPAWLVCWLVTASVEEANRWFWVFAMTPGFLLSLKGVTSGFGLRLKIWQAIDSSCGASEFIFRWVAGFLLFSPWFMGAGYFGAWFSGKLSLWAGGTGVPLFDPVVGIAVGSIIAVLFGLTLCWDESLFKGSWSDALWGTLIYPLPGSWIGLFWTAVAGWGWLPGAIWGAVLGACFGFCRGAFDGWEVHPGDVFSRLWRSLGVPVLMSIFIVGGISWLFCFILALDAGVGGTVGAVIGGLLGIGRGRRILVLFRRCFSTCEKALVHVFYELKYAIWEEPAEKLPS